MTLDHITSPNFNFYPRPHMEGDCLMPRHPVAPTSYFYPRPHMEGDLYHWCNFSRDGNFYPRPHMEGDNLGGECPENCIVISTHALTWRATKYTPRHQMTKNISTHALTWRATRPLAKKPQEPRISTHALTWRATANMLKCRRAFQQLI